MANEAYIKVKTKMDTKVGPKADTNLETKASTVAESEVDTEVNNKVETNEDIKTALQDKINVETATAGFKVGINEAVAEAAVEDGVVVKRDSP